MISLNSIHHIGANKLATDECIEHS